MCAQRLVTQLSIAYVITLCNKVVVLTYII